jgi:hypothetical protein
MNATTQTSQRPYFFWDYDINDEEIQLILRRGSPAEKAWVISRILEYAKWDDTWPYLTVADIRRSFEQLRFRRPKDRELWACALDRWAGSRRSLPYLRVLGKAIILLALSLERNRDIIDRG